MYRKSPRGESTRTRKAKLANYEWIRLFSLCLQLFFFLLWDSCSFFTFSARAEVPPAYLPAAERKVQGTLRGWGVLACSLQHRKPLPEHLSPGREPRRSVAPTVTHQNCDERCRKGKMCLFLRNNRKLAKGVTYSECEAEINNNNNQYIDSVTVVLYKSGVVPPHVAALGEEGELDDLRGHPGVGPRCAHLGGLVPLTGQTEVCDLQDPPAQVVPLRWLQDEDWAGGAGEAGGEGGGGGRNDRGRGQRERTACVKQNKNRNTV